MNAITLSTSLLLATIFGFTGLIFLLIKRKVIKQKYIAVYPTLILLLSSYTIIVGNALGHDLYYQWNVNQYDLNQNGSFDKTEITPDQEKAMERLTNDSGRKLSYISGFIVSLIVSVCFYAALRVQHAFNTEDTQTHT